MREFPKSPLADRKAAGPEDETAGWIAEIDRVDEIAYLHNVPNERAWHPACLVHD